MLQEKGGRNLYAFSRNNSVNLWDYIGMLPSSLGSFADVLYTSEDSGSGRNTGTENSPGKGYGTWGHGKWGWGYYNDPSDMYTESLDLDLLTSAINTGPRLVTVGNYLTLGGGSKKNTPTPFRRVTSTPPNSAAFIASVNGPQFLAPAGTDFAAIFMKGLENGPLNIVGINAAVGHYGTFDFQRNAGNGENTTENVFYSQYTNASNFSVGVFMRGAGFTLEASIEIATSFARAFSSNTNELGLQISWWTLGWLAADSDFLNVTPAPVLPVDGP